MGEFDALRLLPVSGAIVLLVTSITADLELPQPITFCTTELILNSGWG